MTRIKICGLKRPEDIAYVNEAKPDFCGFIIQVPKSSRNVAPDTVRTLVGELSREITPVGVFVNAPLEEILSLTLDGTLGAVQLHGQEDSRYIETLKRQISVPVIKAFSVSSKGDLDAAAKSPADYVLLDNGKGGTGEAFDWSLLSDLGRPYFLAGGLTPENLTGAVRSFHPYAVDLSSGVETNGYKDKEKICAAIAAVRSIEI